MSRFLGEIDHLRGCFYVLQNFLQGMDHICSGIPTLPAVAVRVLPEREGLGCRRSLRAVTVCLPRDSHEERAPLRMELVSAGHGQDLSGFSCPWTKLWLCAARERSLLCSGNDDEPWESVTSTPAARAWRGVGGTERCSARQLPSCGSTTDDLYSIK